jgi:hypothetical protein
MPRNNLYGVAPASSVDMRSATLGVWDFRFLGGIMSVILTFASKWVRWYRVLRYAKAFSFFASVRYGLWLARS